MKKKNIHFSRSELKKFKLKIRKINRKFIIKLVTKGTRKIV